MVVIAIVVELVSSLSSIVKLFSVLAFSSMLVVVLSVVLDPSSTSPGVVSFVFSVELVSVEYIWNG